MKIKILLFFIMFSLSIFANIVVIDVKGNIDMGLPLTVERGIKYAKHIKADKIILRINTFGGRVDAATEIKDAVLNSNIPVYAFVNNRAISAGALIALACDTIVMTTNSTIGAATPVDGKGHKLTEKVVSFMRAEMRSTLESRNKNPIIGEAMVDENIELDSIAPKGKLLTLTSIEAKNRGVADTLINNFDSLLKYMNDNDYKIIEESNKEKIIRLLSYPLVSSILLAIGLMGLFFELRTPGIGFPGIIGILSLTIYISSHYILRLANGVEIAMIAVGLLLILLEIFLIPGFGVAGVTGFALTGIGLYYSMISKIPIASDYYYAGLSLFIVVIVVFVLSYYLFKMALASRFYKNNSLQNSENYVEIKDVLPIEFIGEVAKTVTILRPSGKIEINDKIYFAVSNGEYVEKNSKVKIIDVIENNYLVKIIKEN